MKPTSPLERALISDADAVRRDPPSRLRASILARLDTEPAWQIGPAPQSGSPLRERSRVRPLLAVAAGVLIAGLVWVVTRSNPTQPLHDASTAGATSQRANDVKVALASLRQGAAIDGPLLAEAENLSRDTTRATRYLLDRVTTPFLPRGTPR